MIANLMVFLYALTPPDVILPFVMARAERLMPGARRQKIIDL
jgi:hypothetical protein